MLLLLLYKSSMLLYYFYKSLIQIVFLFIFLIFIFVFVFFFKNKIQSHYSILWWILHILFVYEKNYYITYILEEICYIFCFNLDLYNCFAKSSNNSLYSFSLANLIFNFQMLMISSFIVVSLNIGSIKMGLSLEIFTLGVTFLIIFLFFCL